MSDKFETILIIGATSGLGEGLARRFNAEGKKVIVTGRRQDRLNSLVQEMPNLSAQQMDTEDIAKLPESVERLFAGHPNIDTVIAMAGIQSSFDFKDPKSSSPAKIQSEVTINVTAPMVLAQLMIPRLLSLQRPTNFVLVSSALGFIPVPLYPVYCATKAAIHSLAVNLRAQLAGSTCRIVELAPPYVDGTGLDVAHRAKNIEAQGGEEKAMKPMPQKEYLDKTMEGFKQEDVMEICTGFSEMGVSTWRKAFGPILEMMGIQG
ncbi:MAG: hypothetical protein Q9171_006573 [Xanthocarpia ochracea]